MVWTIGSVVGAVESVQMNSMYSISRSFACRCVNSTYGTSTSGQRVTTRCPHSLSLYAAVRNTSLKEFLSTYMILIHTSAASDLAIQNEALAEFEAAHGAVIGELSTTG